MRKLFHSVLLLLILSVVSGSAFAQDSLTDVCDAATPADEPASREFDAAEQVLEPGVDYRAVFCTGAGPVYVDLFENLTPVTVNNFVFLAENGYYNNTTFHRVIADFMAQGGDPTGTGTGGPGYQFQDEFVGFLTFDRPGLLAMANAGQATNGSQFFLTTSEPDYLNFAHTIFGEVLSGYDNVQSIDLRDPQADTEPGTSLDTVVIITDPSTVEADYEVAEPASEEDLEAVLDDLPELQGLTVAESTGIYSTDDLAAQSEANGEFLSSYNHLYSVYIEHDSADCDLSAVPFESISYEMSVFETPEDAAAAMNDENIQAFVTEDDAYEVIESDIFTNPVYQKTTDVCDEEGTSTLVYRQIGRVIAVSNVLLPSDIGIGADLYIEQIVNLRIYETLFVDALRAEVVQ